MKTSSFSQRLSQAMRQSALSATALASSAGVTHPCVLKWLAGAHPTAEKIPVLAKCLGVSMAWLLTGQEETPSPKVSTAPRRQAAPSSFWERSFRRARALALEELAYGNTSGARLWARFAREDFAKWKAGAPAPTR